MTFSPILGACHSAIHRASVFSDIRDAIAYCPDAGTFTWKVRPSKSIEAGTDCGYIHRGYRWINFAYKGYAAHRVAWFIMTGEWPSHKIDHRNRDGADNRWSNLRAATQAQNLANRRGYGKYPKGVKASKKAGRYHAQIMFGGQYYHLGTFDSVDEASAAYDAAAIKYHGEFARVA